MRGLIMVAALAAGSATTDFDALWNYDDPAGTEAEFRAVRPALEAAGDHGRLLELDTQIARTEGLQRRFAEARTTLDTVHAALRDGEARALIRYELEYGRMLRSSGHRDEAGPHFAAARDLAASAHEEALAIDAIHMLALVEPDPARQIALNQDALHFAETSTDPKARRWQGSLWNNIGMTYHDLGQLDRALAAFKTALALREQEHDTVRLAGARWMVAWTQRLQGDLGDALATQEALERELAGNGQPDGYVFEELGEIHLALATREPAAGHADKARGYFARAYAVLKDDPDLADDPARLARMKRLAEGAAP
jgi:tetratricopeptide (TPR) repeat protein